jgi:molybdenum cofactor cytidylyltransferase
MSEQNTNALILAAGLSTRMGKPKHALKLSNGSTFLESLVRQYLDFGCDKIVVVLNPVGLQSGEDSVFLKHRGVSFVENPMPEQGRFLSIKLGLKILGYDLPVFMQNVDNPFAAKRVLEKLKKHISDFDFVKPVYEGKGGHPVLLGPKTISASLKQPSTDLNFKNFLESFIGTKVEVDDENILININTPEDYERFFSNRS